ncbi:uncharacterized protein LOC119295890 [Triticum dicoccoides]|uniref:uncharacterized protein LOC119295890 n=1 Tax=Triticum dicoccoides TaxID=85692 RepID=UPI00188DDF89|nr:uncharacterized protein LOC119295890 [Triticum dicoccoides]
MPSPVQDPGAPRGHGFPCATGRPCIPHAVVAAYPKRLHWPTALPPLAPMVDPWWAAGSRPLLCVETCWRPSSSTGCRPPRASGSKPPWLSDAPVRYSQLSLLLWAEHEGLMLRSNLRLPSSADVSWMWRSSMCS